ncbi:hypothetical protein ACFXNW_07990 [Nocardia sp. NPDC059180]|uniref:hypothetical protein n=1 Tax=Nocardia sp. NPDC059180 TaxID=3346761 RepID=UPI0036A446FD
MIDREELRLRYQRAREKRDSPWETPEQREALARARDIESDLGALESAAVKESESRAYQEFMARRPGPMRLDPATWSLGKRLMIALRPWHYRWSGQKAGLARWEARQKFFQDYTAEHGTSYRSDLDQAHKARAALDQQLYPRRSAAEREMTEVLKALYSGDGSVEEIAEYLGERPEAVGFLLGLRLERRSAADGGNRWITQRGSGSSGRTGWRGTPGGGGSAGGSSVV